MATVQKFEDLICWQRARQLTKFIYDISKYRKDISTYRNFDSGLANQIQRAAVSVMSNISEGFERGTRAEFINYLFIAKGSAGEVRNQLYVALDNGYLNDETFKRLNRLSEDCSVLIWRLVQSLKVSTFKGLQFRKEKTKQQLKAIKFQKWLDDSEKAREIGEKPPEFEEFDEQATSLNV